MDEQAKKAYNEYMRQWRKKNKDKCKAYKEKAWKKKAENMEDSNDKN